MPRHKQHDHHLRERITQCAARLMSETGIRDYQMAKHKAAASLGVVEGKHMPTNAEIEEAVVVYQRLFDSEDHPQCILELRRAAYKAMAFLDKFKPRLTGAVLSGTASRHAAIELHLFCDYPEQVNIFLMESKIPFEEKHKRVHLRGDEYADYPLLRFMADEAAVELLLFSNREIRQAPLSRVNSKPMQRASLSEVERLIV